MARTASPDEIKRAFRRLAREVHPDVRMEPDADHPFREIVEAYEVLSNSERRELYDRFGHADCAAAVSSPPPSTSATSQISSPRSSAMTSSAGAGGSGGRGRGAESPPRSRSTSPRWATGTHRDVPFGVAVPCRRCGGERRGARHCDLLRPDLRRRRSRAARFRAACSGSSCAAGTCPTCAGSGRIVEKECEQCHGAGRVIEEQHPRGRDSRPESTTGSESGLSGEGHSGTPGARAGDAYVEVHVRHNDHSYAKATTSTRPSISTFTQAALGATVSVPTLDGEAELTFDPGRSRERPVLRGRGPPVLQGFGRGNQRVLVRVTVPRQLTEEQRRLLDEFDGLSTM